jgi:Domain of unknown function (DU1801)
MAENRNPEVDSWFESYDNPQKDLVQAVRQAILDADPRVTEAIKWQAPTFMFRGNIASFYPKAKQHVSLLFHQGASLPIRPVSWKAKGTPRGWPSSPMPKTSPPSSRRLATWCGPGSRPEPDSIACTPSLWRRLLGGSGGTASYQGSRYPLA